MSESYTLFQVPELRLLVPSLPVQDFQGIGIFLNRMICIMEKDDGVGLAAPQIGYNIQIITLSLSLDKYMQKKELVKAKMEAGYSLLNPKIVSTSKDKSDYYNGEGCLSLLKAKLGKVNRYQQIVLEYQNHLGEKCVETVSGVLATVIQHEIDHLHGILYPARMSKSEQKSLVADYIQKGHATQNEMMNFIKLMDQNLNDYEKGLYKVNNLSDFIDFASGIGIKNPQTLLDNSISVLNQICMN